MDWYKKYSKKKIMKKFYFYFTIIVLTAFVMTSCGSKANRASEKLSDEKKELIESLNYRKACENKDFLTAYEIVDELKSRTSYAKVEYDAAGYDYKTKYFSKYQEAKKVSDEAERYVVLQEAMLVLESEGSNGLMRIVGIAKEHKVEAWLFHEMADLANKIGDTDLETKFNNMKPTSGSDDLDESVLIPSQMSISGPLNGYFTIVDKKYEEKDEIKYKSHTIFVEFKRIKKGMPEKMDYNSKLQIGIEYLDEKDNVVGKDFHFLYQQKQMLSCNLKEVASVSFSRYGNDPVKKFRIYSFK